MVKHHLMVIVDLYNYKIKQGNKKNTTSGIYGYWDKLKDEIVYVGQAVDIRLRHNEHYSPARYNAQTINRVLQSNKNRYEIIILKECSIDYLDFWEITLIAVFNPKFNFTDGGEGSHGFKHSLEIKQKLSKMLSGVNSANYGKKFDESHRKKIGESNKGYKKFLGKKHSEETKQKIREAQLGKKASDEARRNMSKAQSKLNTTTGFFLVSKKKHSKYKKGFIWSYIYLDNKKRDGEYFHLLLLNLKKR